MVAHLDLVALGYKITGRSGGFVALDYFGNRILAFHKPQAPQLADRSDNGAEAANSGAKLLTF